MIRLNNISFSYDKTFPALNSISLNISQGQTAAILGPNGCGKTTLLKLLNGIVFADSGTYTFKGETISRETMKDTKNMKLFHQRVGYVFQNADTQLFCGSVEDEIAFGPRQMGLPEDTVHQRTEDCLKLLGINDLRGRAPYHLSGGEKKKAAIACVLSLNPEVLIMDEPLAGLDRKTQIWLTGFLSLLKQTGKTLIFTTHSDSFAAELADMYIEMGEDHGIVNISDISRK